jgi:hypothetical protein
MEIRPVGAELFHAEKHDESVAFRNFANEPNKHQCAKNSATYRVTSAETMAAFTE